MFNSTQRRLFGAVALSLALLGTTSLVSAPTFAQDGGGAGQGQGGPGGNDSAGQGGPGGSDNAGQGQGASDQGQGQGGPSEDSDAQGPRAGQPSGEDRGGKPAWAQEGIPAVDLGRLSVIRSPDQVLDQALAEVVATFSPDLVPLYEMTAGDFGDYVLAHWSDEGFAIIDSPLQNLALLEELWQEGDTSLPGVDPASNLELAAILIGTASDKTLPVSYDTVLALAVIVGAVNLSEADIQYIAAAAEAVRIDVATAHG
ncbi:hypothetical protein [Devosia salina]|uniref:Secreted protein n=1 Tax=Devosia salina TaxID=2860336 RepID=A0ABX8WKU7_9HYPH|nr:hypothetical protein [Devosia salina]QYO77317.1 hypothetical protein K1X15_01675 [Devosia salina]